MVFQYCPHKILYDIWKTARISKWSLDISLFFIKLQYLHTPPKKIKIRKI